MGIEPKAIIVGSDVEITTKSDLLVEMNIQMRNVFTQNTQAGRKFKIFIDQHSIHNIL